MMVEGGLSASVGPMRGRRRSSQKKGSGQTPAVYAGIASAVAFMGPKRRGPPVFYFSSVVAAGGGGAEWGASPSAPPATSEEK